MTKLTYIFIIYLTLNTCYAKDIHNNTNIKCDDILLIIISLIFILCYILIALEEKIKIRKSTISMLFAAIMWIILAYLNKNNNDIVIINKKLFEILYTYCELFIFLFITITYINVIKATSIINKIQKVITKDKISYKKLYWITGLLAFFISPIADNLTTVLFISSILTSIEKNDKNFLNLSSINIVIAANAGGVFSPFGDITTLMIWQNNLINSKSFLYTLIPSFVSFIVPSLIISRKIEKKIIYTKINDTSIIMPINNTYISIPLLFIFTIIITTLIHLSLKISPIIGMLLGFTLLEILESLNNKRNTTKINIKKEIKNINWDTLLFFLGIMLCIGTLSIVGILDKFSFYIYTNIFKNISIELNYTLANSIIGILSAIIDNIPITYALIEMNPNMPESQWLVLNLAIGTGGSILSIGSAAGVALMGVMNKKYTFISHLKWSWSIIIGYILSIIMQIIINTYLFN